MREIITYSLHVLGKVELSTRRLISSKMERLRMRLPIELLLHEPILAAFMGDTIASYVADVGIAFIGRLRIRFGDGLSIIPPESNLSILTDPNVLNASVLELIDHA